MCIYIRIYVCLHICTMDIRTYVYIDMYIRMLTYMHNGYTYNDKSSDVAECGVCDVYICMYMCKCIYAYMYIYTHIYIHVYTYMYICIGIYVCGCTYNILCGDIGKYEFGVHDIYTCVYIYIWICVCMYMCIHTPRDWGVGHKVVICIYI